MALFSFFKNLFKKKNQELPVTIDLDVVKKTEVTEDVSLFVPTSELDPVVTPVEKKEPIKIEKKKKAQPKTAKETPAKATKTATKRAPKKEKK